MPDTPAAPVTAEVWTRFRAGLLAFLLRRLPSQADAEDVLQDVFVRIHEGASDLRHPDRLQPWVFAIAHRAVADFYRAHGRRPDDLPAEAAAEPAVEPAHVGVAPHPDGHDVHDEVLSWLVPLVDALPDGYREAVRLADLEGLTQQAVADRLGLSLSGAKSRVQRGRALLGDLLRACCEVEFGPDGRAVEYRPRTGSCADDC
ncbi:MAG: sigma-70 family RNA polymerase sigma factor [Rhodothermales bacterium]